MKMSQKRKEELKPKKKATLGFTGPTPIAPIFPPQNVDNSEMINRLEEINEKVSREPRSIAIPENSTPVIKEGNESLAKLMNDNTNRIIRAITEKKSSSMEMIPERQGGIIQRIIIKPI